MVALKKSIDDLESQLKKLDSKINKIDGDDEGRYRKKSDKLDGLRRDIRTLYLNRLYLDCVENRDKYQIPFGEEQEEELNRMEVHSKTMMSNFNLLVNKIRKEERIKYVLQKCLQEKPFLIKIKSIEIEEYEKELRRRDEILAELKDNIGIEDEYFLEEMLQSANEETFFKGRLKHMEETLKYK